MRLILPDGPARLCHFPTLPWGQETVLGAVAARASRRYHSGIGKVRSLPRLGILISSVPSILRRGSIIQLVRPSGKGPPSGNTIHLGFPPKSIGRLRLRTLLLLPHDLRFLVHCNKAPPYSADLF